MNQVRTIVLLLSVLAIGLGCAPVSPPPEIFAMRVVATGLQQPLELAFGPDGYLWLTERVGKRVLRINPADGARSTAVTITEVDQKGGQDGLLGMVLHPDLLQDQGTDYVYVAYTYDAAAGTAMDRRVKIRRYTYNEATQKLDDALDLITGLPGSSDHNAGRLVLGPDEKLYYAIGDQGNNQFDNACKPILAQVLPTAAEVRAADWRHYPGKILRLNLDGSIPDDNPELAGVRSHVYSYGHRNVQGLAISADGQLYATEHGPKSDDEVNLIQAGKNYGWPHVAGYQDDQAYVYGNWSAASNCARLEFNDFAIPSTVPQQAESEWSHPDFTPPLKTFYTVEDDYDFQNEECTPNEFICWPTVAPTGLELYAAPTDGMPGWTPSLLMAALKTGTVYRMALTEDGTALQGDALPLFKTINRYRDLALNPDGRTFYVITDNDNFTFTQDAAGLPTDVLENPGALLEFTYAPE